MSYQGKPMTSSKNNRDANSGYGSNLNKLNKTREESAPGTKIINTNLTQSKNSQFIETAGYTNLNVNNTNIPAYARTNHKKNLKLNNLNTNVNSNSNSYNMSQSYCSPNHYSSNTNTPTTKSINKKDLFSVLSPKTKKELLSLNLVKGGINNLYNNFNYTTNINSNNNERHIEQINLNLNMNNVNNVNVNNINHINANIHPDLGMMTTNSKIVNVGSLSMNKKNMARKNIPNIAIDNEEENNIYEQEFNIDNEGNLSENEFHIDYEEEQYPPINPGEIPYANIYDEEIDMLPDYNYKVLNTSPSPSKHDNLKFPNKSLLIHNTSTSTLDKKRNDKFIKENVINIRDSAFMSSNINNNNSNLVNNIGNTSKSISGYSSPKYTKLIDSLKFQFSEITNKEKTLKKNFTLKENKFNNKLNIKDDQVEGERAEISQNEQQEINRDVNNNINNKNLNKKKFTSDIGSTPKLTSTSLNKHSTGGSSVTSDKNRERLNPNSNVNSVGAKIQISINQVSEVDKPLNSYNSNKLLHSHNSNISSSHVKSPLNSSHSNVNLDNPIFKKIAHIKKTSFNLGHCNINNLNQNSSNISKTLNNFPSTSTSQDQPNDSNLNFINKNKKKLNASSSNITNNNTCNISGVNIVNTNASIVINSSSNLNSTGKRTIENRTDDNLNLSTYNNEYKPVITAPAELEKERYMSPTAQTKHTNKASNRDKEKVTCGFANNNLNIANCFSPNSMFKRNNKRDVSNSNINTSSINFRPTEKNNSELKISVGINTDENFGKDNKFSTENINDEVFFNDKRYLDLLGRLKDIEEENKFLKDEDKNLKFTIEILKSYTKVQEVSNANMKEFFFIIKNIVFIK